MSNIQQANHGFHIQQSSNKVIFTYKQEKYQVKNLLPLAFGLPIISLLLIGLVQPSSINTGIVWWLFFIVSLFMLIKYLMNLSRNEKEFSIDKNSIDIGDKTYLRKDITSMYIQKGKSEPVANVNMNNTTGAFIAFNATPAGLMAASAMNAAHGIGRIGDAAGQKFRENIARLNCKLMIRYGNKNVPLATGLTFDTAEVMLDKVVEVTQQLKSSS